MRVVVLVAAVGLALGCRAPSGYGVTLGQGGGGIDSTSRPGGFNTDERTIALTATWDASERLEAQRAQIRASTAPLAHHQDTVESDLQRVIADLGVRLDTKNSQILSLEATIDTQAAQLTEHHEEGPLDQSDYTIGAAAIALLGTLAEMLRRSRKHD